MPSPAMIARAIAASLDAILFDLSQARCDHTDLDHVALVRDEARQLRAVLEQAEGGVEPPAEPVNGDPGVTLEAETYDAWQLINDFRKALQTGSAQEIEDAREDLIDFSQQAGQFAVRRLCANTINEGQAG